MILHCQFASGEKSDLDFRVVFVCGVRAGLLGIGGTYQAPKEHIHGYVNQSSRLINCIKFELTNSVCGKILFITLQMKYYTNSRICLSASRPRLRK